VQHGAGDGVLTVFGLLTDPQKLMNQVTASPFSRTEAIRLIRSFLLKEIASGHRLCACAAKRIGLFSESFFVCEAVTRPNMPFGVWQDRA
jgi:hypothetical protein